MAVQLEAKQREHYSEWSNKDLLDFIAKNDEPECVALMLERRCAFWSRYRDALIDLQHLVLAKDIDEMRKKIGFLLDTSQWINAIPENTEDQPFGGMLIDRLRTATKRIDDLRKRLRGAHDMLEFDDEIFQAMRPLISITTRKKSRNGSSIS